MTIQRISGLGTLSQIGDVLSAYKVSKIMLVTGKKSFAACGAKPIVDDALSNHTVTRFSDFDINPKIEDAERGVAIAREAGIELIMGIGGGSVMDMAKLIKALYSQPEKSYELARGEIAMDDPGIPMILVPTTAGSGSEATHFAVVYIGLNKFSLAANLLLPEEIVLDGSLTASTSPYQKACNGLDALSQAIESAWAAGSTEESREYSFRAVSLCASYLKDVVATDAHNDALQGMLEASNLAGQAINISKTTAAHAWSYGMTSHHGIPHGHAVWLTLPEIFEIHANASKDAVTHPLGKRHHDLVMTKLMKILGITSANDCANHLKAFLAEIGIESNMAKLGAVDASQREFLSMQVNMQRMSNNPVLLGDDDIKRVFGLIER